MEVEIRSKHETMINQVMKLIIVLLLFSSSLFSQQSKIRILGEEKINDSLVNQIAEVMIFNNTAHPLCLKVSWRIVSKILSRDTIELAPNMIGNCKYYDLWAFKEDTEIESFDLPRYPLVINSRTCFFATVKVLKNLNCKESWIEYSYINQSDIDYSELVKKFENHQVWDRDPKIKYSQRRINLWLIAPLESAPLAY